MTASQTAEVKRKTEIRERARREIPALRKQAAEGIATLKRLSARKKAFGLVRNCSH